MWQALIFKYVFFLQIKEMFQRLTESLLYPRVQVKLQSLFQAALELSTSTKPYDCVTASYLLNFLIWQNVTAIIAVCLLKTQRVACGDGDKSAAVVESNTLIGLH